MGPNGCSYDGMQSCDERYQEGKSCGLSYLQQEAVDLLTLSQTFLLLVFFARRFFDKMLSSFQRDSSYPPQPGTSRFLYLMLDLQKLSHLVKTHCSGTSSI
jgi:hypothetical protein